MAPMAYRSNSWNKEADANDELAQPVGLQPTTRKVSPKRIVLGSLMCLAGLAMLQKPMTHCYRKVEHMCHRPRTFEERAHKILTESPLIGNPNLTLVRSDSAANHEIRHAHRFCHACPRSI